MGFTTPCFIKKNAPGLRRKLEELGYTFVPNGYGEWNIPIEDCEYLKCDNGTYQGSRMYYYMGNVCKPNFGVDCGENVWLFISIAALRDDTDNNQVFVNGKGDWGIRREYPEPKISGMEFFYLAKDMDEANYHKAIVEEIVELFKSA